jgi:hypothetical protein
MSATGAGPLTQLARSIQARNQQYQQELTAAALQAASNPAAALAVFEQCWSQADQLEKDELGLLVQMGAWGSQQLPQAQKSWKESRLQILVGKAQVLMLLGRYDDAQSAIESARSYLSDANHPAAAMLDELEITIIQAKG